MHEELKQAALAARHRAHAPFSHFHVGAALETADGRIWAGCNVESSSYGLTICAERTAVFGAIAAGASQFVRCAVAVDAVKLAPPCGACRQVLWDLCGDIEILLFNLEGDEAMFRLAGLFPDPFDATCLD